MVQQNKLTDHMGYMIMSKDPAESGPVIYVPQGGTWIMVQRDDIMLAPVVRDLVDSEAGVEVAAVLFLLEAL